ncbi:MAG: tripartite tricarboxylate transporter substrate binding protein [Ramlibacter sp.]|nr:tripartite tricarboxylate transporter substrate binding protein [Ramlibacter sp.]
MKKRTFLSALALGGIAPVGFTQPGEAPIRIIIPLGPGSPSDFATRIVAQAMAEELKRPIMIDNKPGANGWIAVQDLMRAKPDGNTLMLGGISPVALNVAMFKNLSYDPRKDFTYIGGIYTAFQGYIVSSNLGVSTFPEFIAHAKKNPGKVSVGHYSALTKIQFAAISKLADVQFLDVPYKAQAPATTDLMGGTVDATICDISTAHSLAKGGKIKVIATSLEERSPLAQGTPPASEFIPGLTFPAWSGIIGPAGMPRDVVVKLNAGLNAALRRKDTIAKLGESAVQAWPTTPEELASYVDREITRWVRLAGEAGIQPE